MQYDLDNEDATVLLAHLLGLGVISGVAKIEAFGISLSDTLFDSGTVALSIAGLLAAGTWAFVYLTNDSASIPSLDDDYGKVVAGSLVLTGAMVFSPDVATWVSDQHDLISVGVPLVSTAGLGAMGYLR